MLGLNFEKIDFEQIEKEINKHENFTEQIKNQKIKLDKIFLLDIDEESKNTIRNCFETGLIKNNTNNTEETIVKLIKILNKLSHNKDDNNDIHELCGQLVFIIIFTIFLIGYKNLQGLNIEDYMQIVEKLNIESIKISKYLNQMELEYIIEETDILLDFDENTIFLFVRYFVSLWREINKALKSQYFLDVKKLKELQDKHMHTKPYVSAILHENLLILDKVRKDKLELKLALSKDNYWFEKKQKRLFQEKLPELVKNINYSNRYIYFLDGEVIDHDLDEEKLINRILENSYHPFLFIEKIPEKLK